MTWKMDQSPAPSRINNDDCPITIAPHQDGTWGLRFEGDIEVLGNFPSAQLAHTYAVSRWTCVRPLSVVPNSPPAKILQSVDQRLQEISKAFSEPSSPVQS